MIGMGKFWLRATPVESILVYVTSDADNALGENVFKLPMLFALADHFPKARISWVPGTSGSFYLQNVLAPLVGGRIHEFINDLAIPVEPWPALRTRHPILKRRFDLIIDTQRYVARTMFLRRILHRRFISDNWRYAWSDRWPPKGVPLRPRLLTDKLLGLAATAAGQKIVAANPIPVGEAWLKRAVELMPPGPLYVGVAPGIGDPGSGRGYPVEQYLAVARELAKRGRTPVIFLGPAERQLTQTVRDSVPEAMIPDLDGPLGGPTLTVALAGHLHAAVASDAGPAHLLAAGGAPMVSLFGPSNPLKRAPFSRAIIVLRSQDYGSNRVEAIPGDAVVEAIERQIRIGPARSASL
jgi:ADP-heptose:LPS heptosyltransferase